MTGDDVPRLLSGWPRALHWINALSVIGLISSGWTIFNASPFYPLTFPAWSTLGGDLTQGLRWHFTLMWSFAASSLMLILQRGLLARGGPRLRPVRLRPLVDEAGDVMRARLVHRTGVYLHTQRLLYLLCFLVFIVLIGSGLVLWKPVQLQDLADLMGGYEAARRVHFWSMAGMAAFLAIHLAMALLVPRTIVAMVFGGRLRGRAESGARHDR